MIKALCFNLYGTLIDIRTDEHDPWVYFMLSRYLAYHEVYIPPERLKEEYFKSFEEHFEKSEEVYPEIDINRVFYDIMQRYGNNHSYSETHVSDTALFFRSLSIRHFSLFPSIIDVLNSFCTKFRLAIIDDAQWVCAEPEIKMLGIDRFFDVTVFSSRFGYKKNDIRLFNYTLEKLEVKPEETVYIGNITQRDLKIAKKAGAKCILFRAECPQYADQIAEGCFFDYAMLENIINAID